MDVRLSPEQRALRDAAASLAARLGPKSVAELVDLDRRTKLDSAISTSGWRELRVPGEGGAPLASLVEVALVAEELSRGLLDAAFLGPSLAAELRRLALVDASDASETILLCPDLTRLASSDEDSSVAIDAAGAERALLLVLDASGDAALGSVAVSATEPRVDLTRPEVVASSGEARVIGGAVGDGEIVRWNAVALALTSAELVGTMRGALELAVDYAKVRRQYGAAIGSYQAVQHLLADAFVAIEGSRSVALHAAWAADALEPQAALHAASVAKAYCSRAARSVCETVIQVHGGIGNTWECLAHVYLRRALLSTDILGGVGPSLALVLRGSGIGASDGLR